MIRENQLPSPEEKSLDKIINYTALHSESSQIFFKIKILKKKLKKSRTLVINSNMFNKWQHGYKKKSQWWKKTKI